MTAGICYMVGSWGLARAWRVWNAAKQRNALRGVLLVAVAMRMILLFLPPTLSDDVYRYRWDGKVQASGNNPYLEPPAASRLEPLRDAEWERINYPRIRSIYPPLAQALFHITYRLNGSVASFRLMSVVGDFLALAAVWLFLQAASLPRWRLALYAWSPLAAVEFASSGHYDGWVAATATLALLAALRGRELLSTGWLAAGMLLKTWPVVLIPLLLRRRPWWHGPAVIAALVVAYLPFADAADVTLQPWLDYTGRWRFNDGVFYLLHAAIGSLAAAKAAAAMIGTAVFAWLWRRNADVISASYWLLLAFILLMPTIHPWYLLWALPLAAIAADRGWVLLCTLAPLSYWILVGAAADSNVWVEPVWPRFAEYVPAAAVWIWQCRTDAPPTPHPPSPDRNPGAVSR